MMSSQILGNLITTFVLGMISNVVYFLVLTILGCMHVLIQFPVPFFFCYFQMFKNQMTEQTSL